MDLSPDRGPRRSRGGDRRWCAELLHRRASRGEVQADGSRARAALDAPTQAPLAAGQHQPSRFLAWPGALPVLPEAIPGSLCPGAEAELPGAVPVSARAGALPELPGAVLVSVWPGVLPELPGAA